MWVVFSPAVHTSFQVRLCLCVGYWTPYLRVSHKSSAQPSVSWALLAIAVFTSKIFVNERVFYGALQLNACCRTEPSPELTQHPAPCWCGSFAEHLPCAVCRAMLKISVLKNRICGIVGVWMDSQRQSSPIPLQWTPAARSGCSEPHPAWPSVSPETGHPPRVWATGSIWEQPEVDPGRCEVSISKRAVE